MSNLEFRNYAKYFLLALGAFSVGAITALIPQLLDPTLPVLNLRIVWAAGLSALIAAYGGSFLPRGGGVSLAQQSDALRAQDVHARDMTVLPTKDVLEIVAGSQPTMSADFDPREARP